MLNIVLYQPEIPQNTGNIMRSCVGFDATLHLIKPYGFTLDEKHLKRAGMDYIKELRLKEYETLEDFLKTLDNNSELFLLTRYSNKSPKDIDFKKLEKDNKKIYFMFGKESSGLPYDLIKKYFNKSFRIPTTQKVRSLNLSNVVAIMLYVATMNSYNKTLIDHEPDSLKGKDFILEVTDGKDI